MNGQAKADATRLSGDREKVWSPPVLSLPKGGGAIRGMGEKFAANPVTGTGSISVPIATSPGRSGFGPQLSLSYDYGCRERIRLVDNQGNVKEAPNPRLNALEPRDQAKQTQTLITYTENRVTRDHDTSEETIAAADHYRTPLPCESRTYELTGLTLPAGRSRFAFEEILDAGTTAIAGDYEKAPLLRRIEKRLIEHVRTYYRRNDFAGPQPLGELQSLALPFDSYMLALTPGLIAEVYSGRASDAMLDDEGRYVHTESNANWWIPSGRIFYSPDPDHTPPEELAYARQHFFLPHCYRDQFHTDAVSTESFVTCDRYDLLVQETRDALGNRVTNGERNLDPSRPPVRFRQDYRVMQPSLVMVVGTAVGYSLKDRW